MDLSKLTDAMAYFYKLYLYRNQLRNTEDNYKGYLCMVRKNKFEEKRKNEEAFKIARKLYYGIERILKERHSLHHYTIKRDM